MPHMMAYVSRFIENNLNDSSLVSSEFWFAPNYQINLWHKHKIIGAMDFVDSYYYPGEFFFNILTIADH